ncbi:menaquinol-cytochrome C reductase iron-sulfur subunit [Pontibacillus halophilus JSM 076056 = DSM 19796]|uniref:Menaquinol:cytochrome c reductase iron-sulfur subunit n=1 Tax=Pontibacillus halophilus JSM 076056 = DSM 19796 TaxID=1385510 RepID=A0A0A5I8I4_9BACI|nr:ubiquinol-cytochrome c reductase iron-sulfur subunit [Pontibacillus halophilus]KGX92152.1 menaquinol-cytochrome C reductase iron-sulfur subunit [Pontibacillus halophilus JSM 076056 = DSM 19796]
MSQRKQQVSRRQFLNYTLTGVGGFMAAGLLAPMVRFAIDPVLQPQKQGDFVSAGITKDKLTKEPQRVDFTIEQEDAWYTSEVTKSAWVYLDENDEIVALSPICKHLGCVVNWEGSGNENQFYCPCHGGLYEKSGDNVPGTPPTAPLDVFEHEVREGTLFLGKAKPRGGA